MCRKKSTTSSWCHLTNSEPRCERSPLLSCVLHPLVCLLGESESVPSWKWSCETAPVFVCDLLYLLELYFLLLNSTESVTWKKNEVYLIEILIEVWKGLSHRLQLIPPDQDSNSITDITVYQVITKCHIQHLWWIRLLSTYVLFAVDDTHANTYVLFCIRGMEEYVI